MDKKKPTADVAKAAMDFWCEIRTRRRAEIVKLREICPHENKSTTLVSNSDGDAVWVSCDDCGKTLP